MVLMVQMVLDLALQLLTHLPVPTMEEVEATAEAIVEAEAADIQIGKKTMTQEQLMKTETQYTDLLSQHPVVKILLEFMSIIGQLPDQSVKKELDN
jgi:hypothetical protein